MLPENIRRLWCSVYFYSLPKLKFSIFTIAFYFFYKFLDKGFSENSELFHKLRLLFAWLKFNNSTFRCSFTSKLTILHEIFPPFFQLIINLENVFLLFLIFLNIVILYDIFFSFTFALLYLHIFDNLQGFIVYEIYFFPHFIHIIDNFNCFDFQGNEFCFLQTLPFIV